MHNLFFTYSYIFTTPSWTPGPSKASRILVAYCSMAIVRVFSTASVRGTNASIRVPVSSAVFIPSRTRALTKQPLSLPAERVARSLVR